MSSGRNTEVVAWFQTRPLRWRVLWLVIAWLLVALVVYLSLTPKMPKAMHGLGDLDKIGHLLAYFSLMCWFGFVFIRRAHLWIAGMLVALGLTLEVTQLLIGYRAFEWLDVAANSSGVLLGMLLVRTPFAGVLVLFERTFDPGLP